MEGKLVKSLAGKLGITSAKIVRKAIELDRLCEVRCASGSLASLGLNQTCRAVMCLELAATSMHHPIDRKDAIRLSGVNKKVYLPSYKTLESVLDLQSVLGIRDLAVQFGCMSGVESAKNIIARYRSDYTARTGDENEVDFSKPMFTLAALYTVCRHQKIKVDKTKMISTAGVKRTTFDKTCSDFEKYATELLGDKKEGKSKQKYWLEELDKSLEEEDDSPIKKRRTETNNESGDVDDYEEWKRKILEGAAAATNRKT